MSEQLEANISGAAWRDLAPDRDEFVATAPAGLAALASHEGESK